MLHDQINSAFSPLRENWKTKFALVFEIVAETATLATHLG